MEGSQLWLLGWPPLPRGHFSLTGTQPPSLRTGDHERQLPRGHWGPGNSKSSRVSPTERDSRLPPCHCGAADKSRTFLSLGFHFWRMGIMPTTSRSCLCKADHPTRNAASLALTAGPTFFTALDRERRLVFASVSHLQNVLIKQRKSTAKPGTC